MLSERFVNVRRGLIAAILLLGIVPAVSAQSISDARRVEFTPSPDHNAVDPNSGAALVTNYTLNVYVAGGATSVSTANLGKPALDVDGMIRLDFVALLTTPLSNGVVYESIVSAVGPGGTSPSARSNTFAFSLPCTPTISPTSSNLTTSAAATGSVAVSVGTGCTWAATSNASWITITSGASGLGNGTVNYSVSANTGTTSRTGTLTVAGNTFTVTQAAAPCTFTISPTSSTLTSAVATTGTVTVTAATGCSWTATSGATWITISAGASGTGNGTVSYSVGANTGTTSRTGALTIGGQTFNVTQPAAPCTFTIAPTLSNLTASVATTGTVTVTAGTGCGWTATSNAAWLTISAGASGSGNGTVNYSVAANTGTTSRTGTLTVAGQTFTVTQAGAPCTFTISPTTSNLPSSLGASGSVTVTAATGCSWTAVSNDAWITVGAGASGTGNGSVSYGVAANTGTTSRTGTLTIGGQTFTVTQPGAPCTFTISPTSSNLTSSIATSGTINVIGAAGCSWTGTRHAPGNAD